MTTTVRHPAPCFIRHALEQLGCQITDETWRRALEAARDRHEWVSEGRVKVACPERRVHLKLEDAA